jgi:hypothetical protein
MAKTEKAVVLMNVAMEATATEIEADYVTCHLFTSDSIPFTAILVFLPRDSFKINTEATGTHGGAN